MVANVFPALLVPFVLCKSVIPQHTKKVSCKQLFFFMNKGVI